MKNLIKLIGILVLILSVNSCGVRWQINSYNDAEVIQTRNQLNWKMQRDWNFANNYYRFLQRQNYTFFQNQYYNNRLHRFGWNSSYDYWMNWQWNWHSSYDNSWMWNHFYYHGNQNTNYWWNYQNRFPYTKAVITPKRNTRVKTNTNYVRPNNNNRPIINNIPNTKPVIIRTKPVYNTRPTTNNRPTRSTTPVRTTKKRGGQ